MGQAPMICRRRAKPTVPRTKRVTSGAKPPEQQCSDSRLDGSDPEPVGKRSRLDAVPDAELGHQVGHVDARRLRADEQRGGDVGVGPAGSEMTEDYLLA